MEILTENPRPSYAERRRAQLAAGASPIPPKNKKKCTCGIRRLWTACAPKSFVEDREGNIIRLRESVRFQPTCFKTEVDANAANERFRACHGYAEEVFWCAVCGAFHLRHRYSSELRKETDAAVTDGRTNPSSAESQARSLSEVPADDSADDGRGTLRHEDRMLCEFPRTNLRTDGGGEIKIGDGLYTPKSAPTSLEVWLDECRRLAKSANTLPWTVGDHLLEGRRTFGKAAYSDAAKATGWGRAYVYRLACVAGRFPQEKRVAGLSFYHFQRVQVFPPEITDVLLPEAVKSGWTGRELYRRACELHQPGKNLFVEFKQVNVRLTPTVYRKLKERAGTGPVSSSFIIECLEEYLVGASIERKESGPRTNAWREKLAAS